jgi:hypothetical protein
VPAATPWTGLRDVAHQHGNAETLARRLAGEQGDVPFWEFAPVAGVLGMEMRR